MLMRFSWENVEYDLWVVGLGYVGLPLALLLSSKYEVNAQDVKESRINELSEGVDRNRVFEPNQLLIDQLKFSCEINRTVRKSIFIVTVPTPIRIDKTPDLSRLEDACVKIGSSLIPGDIVVFESTVYPGCTEDFCVPILEAYSNLKFKVDFNVGYSPERINPGDSSHALLNIDKLISASNEEVLNLIESLYTSIIKASVHRVESIQIAEAAKIIENVQRDVNIALMNELSQLFSALDLKTDKILAAARTKWNFLEFYPGLVGGHCIGVDPYYLINKSISMGFNSDLIISSRRINDSMVDFVIRKFTSRIVSLRKPNNLIKVLILGYTFKENVSDTRNSKIVEVVNKLLELEYDVAVYDINVNLENDENIPLHQKRLFLKSLDEKLFDAVIIGVNHRSFKDIVNELRQKYLSKDGIIFDLTSKNSQLKPEISL